MIKPGSWWIESKIDPRWNRRGRSEFINGLTGCDELWAALQEVRDLYGLENEPADLTVNCWKD